MTDASLRRVLAEQLTSVRARIVGWVVLLAALGLVGAGGAAYLVEAAAIDARINEAIHQEVQEFEELQRTGVDPSTGEPFTRMDQLFRVALQRNVPNEHESIVAFTSGASFVHPNPPFRLARYEPFRQCGRRDATRRRLGRSANPRGDRPFRR